MTLSGMLSS